ncbi:MAG: hypothetical protein H6R18_846 [Proteobacteria bacterium]|nr:hypothetical protein [Pseudomonadota bacterium]
MRKLWVAVFSVFLMTMFVASTANAETTKEAWVKKKKSQADREAAESKNTGGNNAGEARAHNKKVEEKRQAKHKEIDETAKKLGDGKKKR